MSKNPPPLTTAEEIREATREGRELLSDLISAIKRGEVLIGKLNNSVEQFADRLGGDWIGEQIERIGPDVVQTVEGFKNELLRAFNEFVDILTGVDAKSRRKGDVSLTDAVLKIAQTRENIDSGRNPRAYYFIEDGEVERTRKVLEGYLSGSKPVSKNRNRKRS